MIAIITNKKKSINIRIKKIKKISKNIKIIKDIKNKNKK